MKTTRDAANNAQNNVNQDHGEEEWKVRERETFDIFIIKIS